jgi:ferredoxin/flavodoxin---NADP+ reductase
MAATIACRASAGEPASPQVGIDAFLLGLLSGFAATNNTRAAQAAKGKPMHGKHRVLAKLRLSEEVYRMEVEAPLVARERKAGQFVIVQCDDDYAERIPLTIADADPEKGTVTLIFQTVGASTHRLARKEPGDEIVLLGPLGNPTHIENFGWAVCVGGGIGLAPLYPIAKALKAAGNRVTVISGARTAELLIMQDELNAIADTNIVVTDDGTAGIKALVTAPLKELCSQNPQPDIVVTIGPPIMMKFCAETTRPFGVKTLASLNTIMIDGTGMCGGCRVSVGGETKFVCVDGPEFDAHLVDWAQMMSRLGAYKPREKADHDRCHLDIAAKEAAAKEAAAKEAAASKGGRA